MKIENDNRKLYEDKAHIRATLSGGVNQTDEVKTQKVDVIFATNNNFCSHAAEAIVSLLETNKEKDFRIHLLTIDCNVNDIEKIRGIVERYNQLIVTYPITNQIFANFPETGAYSLACYLRLLAPSLLPNIDKALYLDCDLIVNGDISELWDMDITDYAVAAVHDATLSYNIVKGYLGYDYWQDGYFNSGVLLMNLKYWREHGLQQKLVDYLNTHKVSLPDQDALNIVLHGSVKWIHPQWNCHVGYFAFPPLVPLSEKKYIKELWREAKIIHFTGPTKPWYKECVNPYKKAYLKYRDIVNWNNSVSLSSLEPSRIRCMQIIFLRKVKNIVARIISYAY